MMIIILSLVSVQDCGSEPSTVTGAARCEGCEAIYESPTPFEKLEPMVWLPDANTATNKIAINGTVYNADGSPAAGVILYVYHTDHTGVYPVKGNEKGWAKRHGYLRGWMKTDNKGFYKFFTGRPGSYPKSTEPAHIHIIVKEPGKTEYYLDDYLFDNDPHLTKENRSRLTQRGGNGIIKLTGGMNGKAERNIYLGKNIPGYR